jgi:hypothetical protein
MSCSSATILAREYLSQNRFQVSGFPNKLVKVVAHERCFYGYANFEIEGGLQITIALVVEIKQPQSMKKLM